MYTGKQIAYSTYGTGKIDIHMYNQIKSTALTLYKYQCKVHHIPQFQISNTENVTRKHRENL